VEKKKESRDHGGLTLFIEGWTLDRCQGMGALGKKTQKEGNCGKRLVPPPAIKTATTLEQEEKTENGYLPIAPGPGKGENERNRQGGSVAHKVKR